MHSKSRLRKGQTFMPDYLASMVVFGVLLAMFLSSWNAVIINQTVFKAEQQIRFRGLHTTTFLVSTPGYPENWEENPEELAVPGFADPDHLLQEDKVKAFRQLSYSEQKAVLQVENFYMSIRNDTTVLKLDGANLTYGRDYENASTIVPFTRSVQVNISSEIRNAQLRYIVWR